ncbi:hypothetical protein Tco_0569034 [Tanacetum coccineum]
MLPKYPVSELNEKFDTVNTNLNNVLSQMHFLVADVNRFKENEVTSRFSRLGKLEFPKFYKDDVQGWLFKFMAHGDTVMSNVYEERILKRFGIWDAFGGKARDLGSIWEETGTQLYKIFIKLWFTVRGDGVRISFDAVKVSRRRRHNLL